MKPVTSLREIYVLVNLTPLYSYSLRLHQVIGLYTKQDQKEYYVPFPVYKNEQDLPEEIASKIKPPRYPSPLEHPLPAGTPNEVYVVIVDNDSTGDRGGYRYIFAITENLTLAEKLAIGQGPMGSIAPIIKVSLDTPLQRVHEFILPIYASKVFQRGTINLYVKT